MQATMEIGDGPLPSPVKIILEEFFYQGIFKTFHQRNEKQVPNSDSNTGNTGIGIIPGKAHFWTNQIHPCQKSWSRTRQKTGSLFTVPRYSSVRPGSAKEKQTVGFSWPDKIFEPNRTVRIFHARFEPNRSVRIRVLYAHK